jgi:hypothetical protein
MIQLQEAGDGASGWGAGQCGRIRFLSLFAPRTPVAHAAKAAAESALPKSAPESRSIPAGGLPLLSSHCPPSAA